MNKSLRSWLIACAINVICVLISIRYFDHPIADFLEQHFRHTEGWRFLSLALEPLKIVALAAPLFLFWTGLHRDGKWIKTALVLAWAEVWALATEFVFKQIFGRAWPEPTYIRDHLDGFRWLHAGDGWMSFPSGHALISFALAAVFWYAIPRRRRPVLAVAAVVSAAMVLCNYHWLSDVIAGSFLGWTIGWITAMAPSASDSKYPSADRLGSDSPSAESSNRGG